MKREDGDAIRGGGSCCCCCDSSNVVVDFGCCALVSRKNIGNTRCLFVFVQFPNQTSRQQSIVCPERCCLAAGHSTNFSFLFLFDSLMLN